MRTKGAGFLESLSFLSFSFPGIVVGIGIFKTPPLVAANVASDGALLGAWVLGGVITLIGALVYAELAAA